MEVLQWDFQMGITRIFGRVWPRDGPVAGVTQAGVTQAGMTQAGVIQAEVIQEIAMEIPKSG